MTTSPAISTIIPVYNGVRHIEAALESVLAQQLPTSEVILVDDGSTDGSAELLDRIASEATQVPVVVIHQQNAGQSAARNQGAARARGELLAFLDQDDRWYPEHLRLLVDGLRDERVGFCFGDFDQVDADGAYLARGFLALHEVAHPRLDIVGWLGSDTMVIPSATVVRASAYAQVGGFCPELIGYEDDDLWVRLFHAGWLPAVADEPVAAFRVHAGSSSTRRSFRVSRVVFLRRMAKLFPDNPVTRTYIVTDVLLPRLVRSALGDYLAALRMRDYAEAADVASTIDDMFDGLRSRLLRPRERWVLRHPRLARWALRLRRAVRSPLGARLDPTRRLRDRYQEWVD